MCRPMTQSPSTPPPDPCPTCDGTGEVAKFVPPGLSSDPGSPLGDPRKRTCPDCNGTGTSGGR